MNRYILILLLILCKSIAIAQITKGTASYYAQKFEGRRCSSGEIFRHDSLTCAHKTMPFGTMLKVCNAKGQCVIVKVNDRLPKKSKRTIDLTFRAAKELNLHYAGLMKVTLEVIGKDSIHIKPRIYTKYYAKKKVHKKKSKKK